MEDIAFYAFLWLVGATVLSLALGFPFCLACSRGMERVRDLACRVLPMSSWDLFRHNFWRPTRPWLTANVLLLALPLGLAALWFVGTGFGDVSFKLTIILFYTFALGLAAFAYSSTFVACCLFWTPRLRNVWSLLATSMVSALLLCAGTSVAFVLVSWTLYIPPAYDGSRYWLFGYPMAQSLVGGLMATAAIGIIRKSPARWLRVDEE
ncbi:MAG: hypothetical protein NTW86_13285 [Candidatus Sumerlaeota bacterium]|nr:hypothetical protein [Candidatus Sumerlaeota bacterium]